MRTIPSTIIANYWSCLDKMLIVEAIPWAVSRRWLCISLRSVVVPMTICLIQEHRIGWMVFLWQIVARFTTTRPVSPINPLLCPTIFAISGQVYFWQDRAWWWRYRKMTFADNRLEEIICRAATKLSIVTSAKYARSFTVSLMPWLPCKTMLTYTVIKIG